MAHAAGIRVKMITGDHKGTAVAISRELGIAPPGGDVRALTGADLEAMTQDELRRVVRDVDVYARTSPEHKLRIVRALQSHREVVAMTGDGVNDAPSITRADVGVAMGIKGTEATKEAADIVLADDDFATIEQAVEDGRRIYDNIRKSVVFLLPTNGVQSLVILVAVLLGLALPLSPVQILWVNLITAVTLSLTLAGEPAEPGIMQRPPRSPKEQVLSGRMIVLVVIASLLIGGATLVVYQTERNLDATYAQAQTAAVTMLALAQLAFLFNALPEFFVLDTAGAGRQPGHLGRRHRAAGVADRLRLRAFHERLVRLGAHRAAGLGHLAGLAILVFLLAEAGKTLVRRAG